LRSSAAIAATLLAACSGGPGSSSGEPVVLGPFECGAPATPISVVQGSGATSPRADVVVDVEAVVVGNFQRGLGGFYIESAPGETDADPATSEGLFVAVAAPRDDVKRGRRVRVRGTVGEVGAVDDRPATTAIVRLTDLRVCGDGGEMPVTRITAPPPDWERYEGMRVELPGAVTVTGNDALLRYGYVDVSLAGRLYQPTELHAPGPQARELAAANQRARLRVDDARATENPDRIWWMEQPVSNRRPWRVDTELEGLRGVIDERYGRYTLQLDRAPTTVRQAPRPEAPPEVPGDLRVAAFNLLNWFNGDGAGGGFPTARGAGDRDELLRQRAKLVAAIAAMGADVVALMELENDGDGEASASTELVTALNRALGADGDYVQVPVPPQGLGTDEIRVGLIYRSQRVQPVGAPAALDGGAFATLSRVPLAQTFEPAGGGPRLTVVANHFKSKGGCDSADAANADRGDGQGCWNAARVSAARELADWLATDPTGSGSTDVLIVGDLNAYAQEDPIRLLRERGWVDALAGTGEEPPYSFVWNGESGRLDHALASASLAARIAGGTEWHINADELTVFDYNTDRKSERRQGLAGRTPFRSSDHDPLVVGIHHTRPSPASN
jgi:hypothetical protein